MSPTLTTGPGSSTSSSPLLPWTPCWKGNWRNTLEGQLGSRRPPFYLVLRSCHRLRLLLEGYYCLRHTSGRIPSQEKLLYRALNKTQSSRCFGRHCDIGVTISDCIHCQSLNHKVADNFTLPRVIGTSLSAVLRKLGVIQRALTEYSHQSLSRK